MNSNAYDVLVVVKSKSSPDKTYEIRKSRRDGKTYCTCPGWIFKARKGDGICKHIAEYKKTTDPTIVVMNIEEFLAVKRAMPNITFTEVSDTVEVRRNKI